MIKKVTWINFFLNVWRSCSYKSNQLSLVLWYTSLYYDEALKKTLIEKDALIDALHSEVNQLVKKHEWYESVIENQKVQIQVFELSSKKIHQISDRFKKEIIGAKIK